MSDLPPGLKEFGERLEQAAARDIEARRVRRRGFRLGRLGLPVVAGLVVGAVSASAVRLVDRGGEPIAPEGTLTQAPLDPAVILATSTSDPGGGPPWVVRAFTDASGRECVQVGRLRGGVFGQVQRGRFRALPPSAVGTCAAPGASGPLVAVDLYGPVNLRLVYGLAVDRTTVTVRVGDAVQRVQPAGFGAFLTIFEGVDRSAKAVVRSKIGGREVVVVR